MSNGYPEFREGADSEYDSKDRTTASQYFNWSRLAFYVFCISVVIVIIVSFVSCVKGFLFPIWPRAKPTGEDILQNVNEKVSVSSMPNMLTFSPEGKNLYISCPDRLLRYDMETKSVALEVEVSTRTQKILFNKNGQTICLLCKTCRPKIYELRLRDAKTLELIALQEILVDSDEQNPLLEIVNLAFGPDSNSWILRQWDIKNERYLLTRYDGDTLEPQSGQIEDIEFKELEVSYDGWKPEIDWSQMYPKGQYFFSIDHSQRLRIDYSSGFEGPPFFRIIRYRKNEQWVEGEDPDLQWLEIGTGHIYYFIVRNAALSMESKDRNLVAYTFSDPETQEHIIVIYRFKKIVPTKNFIRGETTNRIEEETENNE